MVVPSDTACVSTVSDGTNMVDLCDGAACKFSPSDKTAVTVECDRRGVESSDNEDVYVDPGMWVLDNVDSWKTADSINAEECDIAVGEESPELACKAGKQTISPTAAEQKKWTEATGTYTVTYKAEDMTGNKADDVTRTVTVEDRFAPTLTLQGDTKVQNSAGAAVNNKQTDATQNKFANWEGADGLFDHSYHANSANGLSPEGGFTCTDSCTATAALKIDVSLYQGAKCNDDGTVGNADESTTSTQIGKTNDWKFPEYVTGSYAIHYRCEDASNNWAEACREVLNVDHMRPIIQILGSNDMTLEASHQGNYVDDGATCSDQVDGVISQNVEVSGDVVNLSKVGTYVITYNCQDKRGNFAPTMTRRVHVKQTSCPTCVCTTCAEVLEHEASFPFTDTPVSCTDPIDG